MTKIVTSEGRPVGDDRQFSFSTRNYAEMEQQANTASDWLASLGIDYYKTRIGRYISDIRRLRHAHETNTLQVLTDNGEFPKLVNSLYESSELISIYEGLHPISSELLVARLRDFVKGTEFATSESTATSSNRARDVAFELFMASLFAKAHYQLDFGTEADLIANDDNNTYLLECKRPRSSHSVRSNVRAAAGQISRRLAKIAAKDCVYGIIAGSISRIINPEMKLVSASSESTIGSYFREISDNFVQEHHQHWSTLEEPRLLGVLLLLQTPAIIESVNVITTCNFIAGNNIVASGDAGLRLFKSMLGSLKPALFSHQQGALGE